MTTGAEALGLYTPNNTLHGEKWSERKRKTHTQDKIKQKTKKHTQIYDILQCTWLMG